MSRSARIDSSESPGLVRRALRLAFLLAVAAAACATAGAWGGRLHWTLELLTHFKVHVLLACLSLLGASVALRYWSSALLCVVLIGANAGVLAHAYLPPEPRGIGEPLRLLLANVNKRNNQTDALLELVDAEDPDLVLLLETSMRWVPALDALAQRYPYAVRAIRGDSFGAALLSKTALSDARPIVLGSAGFPSIHARVEHADRSLQLLLTHPFPPVRRRGAKLRNEQLNAVREYLEGIEGPRVLAGDFNATPWSPYFRDLIDGTAFVDSSRGQGLQSTWPARLPGFLRIPIDHVLHTEDLATRARRIGPSIGSDHLPVIVDLVWR